MEAYFWDASSSSDCNTSSAAPSSSSPSAALEESSSSSAGTADCALALVFPLTMGDVWLSAPKATAVRDVGSREESDLPSLGDFESTSSSSESATRLLLVRPV